MFARNRLLSRMNFRSLNGSRKLNSTAVAGPSKRSANMPRLTILGGGSLGIMLWVMPGEAACMKREDSSSKDGDDKSGNGGMDAVENIIMTTVAPLATKLGYGGVMGVFSGMALKKVGEVVAIGIGVVFIGLQFLQYKGLINIDYGTVKEKGKLVITHAYSHNNILVFSSSAT